MFEKSWGALWQPGRIFELSFALKICEFKNYFQKSINNYAEPSLQLASKLRNRSRQFRSSITEQHPSILKFKASFEDKEKFSANAAGIDKFVSIFKDFQSSPKESPVKEEVSRASKETLPSLTNGFNNGQLGTHAPKPAFTFRPKGEDLVNNSSAQRPPLSSNR